MSYRSNAFIDGPVCFDGQGVQRTKAQTPERDEEARAAMTVELAVYSRPAAVSNLGRYWALLQTSHRNASFISVLGTYPRSSRIPF